MGEGGKVRLRFGSQVIFAGKQGIVKTYNLYEKRVVTPHEEAVRVIEMLNAADTFSLETVIQTLTQDPTELRPVTSRVEGISEDLSVFDIISDNDSDNITHLDAARKVNCPSRFKKETTDRANPSTCFSRTSKNNRIRSSIHNNSKKS